MTGTYLPDELPFPEIVSGKKGWSVGYGPFCSTDVDAGRMTLVPVPTDRKSCPSCGARYRHEEVARTHEMIHAGRGLDRKRQQRIMDHIAKLTGVSLIPELFFALEERFVNILTNEMEGKSRYSYCHQEVMAAVYSIAQSIAVALQKPHNPQASQLILDAIQLVVSTPTALSSRKPGFSVYEWDPCIDPRSFGDEVGAEPLIERSVFEVSRSPYTMVDLLPEVLTTESVFHILQVLEKMNASDLDRINQEGRTVFASTPDGDKLPLSRDLYNILRFLLQGILVPGDLHELLTSDRYLPTGGDINHKAVTYTWRHGRTRFDWWKFKSSELREIIGYAIKVAAVTVFVRNILSAQISSSRISKAGAKSYLSEAKAIRSITFLQICFQRLLAYIDIVDQLIMGKEKAKPKFQPPKPSVTGQLNHLTKTVYDAHPNTEEDLELLSHQLSDIEDVAQTPDSPIEFDAPDDSPITAKVRWGKMKISTPPRVYRIPRWKLTHASKAADMGSIPKRFERFTSDMKVFDKKIKVPGLSILIDDSGSMALQAEDIKQILEAFPASVIAVYAGSDDRDGRGILRIAAKDGTRVDLRVSRHFKVTEYGGNGIDFPALQWLGEQIWPRIWVSDGQVVSPSVGYHTKSIADCEAICSAAGITRFHTPDDLLLRLRDIKNNKFPFKEPKHPYYRNTAKTAEARRLKV